MKITLCGSARFEDKWHEWNKNLTLMGHVVYTLSVFPSVAGNKNWYSDKEKRTLDLVHLAKIEESDAIFVINEGGYIGESTKREIEWARMRGKDVYVSDPGATRYSEKGPCHFPQWAEFVKRYNVRTP